MTLSRLLGSAALAAVLMAASGKVMALPASPVIAATNGPGAGASFAFSPNTLTVTQTNSRVVIDWASFNIGANDAVTFAQPSNTSIALNRVSASSFTTIA